MCVVLEIEIGQRGNLHGQITTEISRLISTGAISTGYALPSTRLLSEHLQVSRNTVIRAYENLSAEGLIEMRPPLGTFVSERLPIGVMSVPTLALPSAKALQRKLSGALGRSPRPTQPTIKYDFQYERPNKDAIPISAWRRIACDRLRAIPRGLINTEHPAGSMELRRAIAEYLGPSRSIRVTPDQIIVTGGLQHSLALAVSTLAKRGGVALVERSRPAQLDKLLEQAGFDIRAGKTDANGLTMEDLAEHPAELICVTAARQFPYGGTMPPERRQLLIRHAQQSNANIIEFEVQNDFRYDGLLPAALARDDLHDRTLLAGGFETSIGPGVRLGYLVVPARLVDDATNTSAMLGSAAGWLEQSVMATFIKSEGYKHHLLRLRKLMMARKEIVLSALRETFASVGITGDNSGNYVLWRLPDELGSCRDVETALRPVGIAIYGLHNGTLRTTPSADDERYVMLGYAGLTSDDLRNGMALLCKTLKC